MTKSKNRGLDTSKHQKREFIQTCNACKEIRCFKEKEKTMRGGGPPLLGKDFFSKSRFNSFLTMLRSTFVQKNDE